MSLKPIQELEHASFRYAFHRSLVQILQTELDSAARKPFEIVEDGPPEGSRHIYFCILIRQAFLRGEGRETYCLQQ